MSYKQVIILRKDLNMRKGKMVAQGSHAVEMVIDIALANTTFKTYRDNWKAEGRTKICVSVDSEAELLEIYRKARDAKLPCSIVTDAGKTEFGGVPTKTAVAIGPAPLSDVDKITGHLKLL
jgi:PTH2 family peptidyl-tRNA hydrolase